MKPDEKNIAKALKSYLPSEGQVEVAGDRVLQRLRSEAVSPEAIRHQESGSIRSAERFWKLAWVAMAVVLAVGVVVVIRSLVAKKNVQAFVETAEGGLQRVTGNKYEDVPTGDSIAFGEVIRSNRGLGSVLVLKDGSRIEMRPKSELVLETADDGVRIRLNSGGVIVTAAKQGSGHLYVQTPDVAVSVVGTVFLVNSEEAGSRVAVIQGEVHVQQGATSKSLLPGEQVATNPLMESHPVVEEVAWSRHAEEHVALLQQNTASTRRTPENAAAPSTHEFEVASIKPAAGGRPTRIRCRGIDGELDVVPAGSAVPAVSQGRCVADAVPLLSLVATAFDIPLERVFGLESHQTEGYQINAKVDDAVNPTRDELRQMLQTMLMNRFKLKFHREIREAPGYVLSVGKSGIKFKETAGDEENVPAGPPSAAALRGIPLKGKFRMKRLTNSLSTFVGRSPVIDKTDLQGVYDVSLVLTPLPSPDTGGSGGRGGSARMEFDPPLAKAIEEQLGLRLESAKVPVEYFVIDQIEKPTND
jgi:uncharacterized protein (TIGR03435 family)